MEPFIPIPGKPPR